MYIKPPFLANKAKYLYNTIIIKYLRIVCVCMCVLKIVPEFQKTKDKKMQAVAKKELQYFA